MQRGLARSRECDDGSVSIAPRRLEHPLLTVFESALLADRLIAFALALRLRFTLALALAATTAAASAVNTAASTASTTAAAATLASVTSAAFTPLADRYYLDHAQKSVAGRACRDQGIVFEREVHDTAVTRRHRVQCHRRMLTLGLFGHRQRHPMELAAAALAVGFGVDGDRHRVLYPPRQDTVDEVLQRIQGLTVTPDEALLSAMHARAAKKAGVSVLLTDNFTDFGNLADGFTVEAP